MLNKLYIFISHLIFLRIMFKWPNVYVCYGHGKMLHKERALFEKVVLPNLKFETKILYIVFQYITTFFQIYWCEVYVSYIYF